MPTESELQQKLIDAGNQMDELPNEVDVASLAKGAPQTAESAAPPAAEPAKPETKPEAEAQPAEQAAGATARNAKADFEAKHGADPEKGYQHYFDVQKQNAAFAKELEQLKAKLAEKEQATSQAKVDAPPATPPEPPASVKELDASILELSQEFNAVESQIKDTKKFISEWQAHREKLLDELPNLTESDQIAKHQQAIAQAKNALISLNHQDNLLGRDRQRIIRDFRSQEFLKRQVLAQHQETETRSSLESQILEKEAQTFRREFASATDRIAAAKGIPADDLADFREEVEIRARYHVNVLDREITDIDQFITQLADKRIAAMRRVAAGYAAQKVADSKPAAPAGKAAVAPEAPKPKGLNTFQDIESVTNAAWAQERI